MTLESYGIGPRECLAAYKAFGGDVVGKVTENPVRSLFARGRQYRLSEFEIRADKSSAQSKCSYRINAGRRAIIFKT